MTVTLVLGRPRQEELEASLGYKTKVFQNREREAKRTYLGPD